MVPSQYGSDLPEMSYMDLFFAVIFYLPVFALGLGVCVFWVAVKTRSVSGVPHNQLLFNYTNLIALYLTTINSIGGLSNILLHA